VQSPHLLADFDLSFLREASLLVDARLRSLEAQAKRSDDADGMGIFDRSEYISGLGLVACQTYITACIARSTLRREKEAALNLGPRHSCGASVAYLVNALANFWKHSSEWSSPLSPRAQRTMDTVSLLHPDCQAPYFATIALATLLRPGEPRIARILPFLAQWNEAVENAA
jgi:hypothetical protein